MPRWEFHLTQDEVSNATRWVWMYRRENGDSITSAQPFGSYGECIRDALRHGYGATGTQSFRERMLDPGG